MQVSYFLLIYLINLTNTVPPMWKFCHVLLQTQLKQNFVIHSDLSIENTDLNRQLQPQSEIWLTLLEILNQLPIRSFFQKVKLRKVHVTDSLTRKIDMPIMSFQFTPLCCPMFKEFAKWTTQKETIMCKKRPFLTVYARWLDSLMASKKASSWLHKNLI